MAWLGSVEETSDKVKEKTKILRKITGENSQTRVER